MNTLVLLVTLSCAALSTQAYPKKINAKQINPEIQLFTKLLRNYCKQIDSLDETAPAAPLQNLRVKDAVSTTTTTTTEDPRRYKPIRLNTAVTDYMNSRYEMYKSEYGQPGAPESPTDEYFIPQLEECIYPDTYNGNPDEYRNRKKCTPKKQEWEQLCEYDDSKYRGPYSPIDEFMASKKCIWAKIGP